jgi:hypothetical protein
MTASLQLNAYHVLGLDGSANAKQILQRSNEITQRLKIGDQPKFILDIQAFKNYRTEKTVKDVLRKLQAPKSQIIEYFFWFHLRDSVDKDAALSHIRTNYKSASQIWKKAALKKDESCNRYSHNSAISNTIALINTHDPFFMGESLRSWDYVMGTHDFWRSFAQAYEHDAGQPITADAFSEFQAGIAGHLSDLYSEIHDLRPEANYIYQFRQAFTAAGEKLNKDLIRPAIQTINSAISEISAIKINRDQQYGKTEAKSLKVAIESIQSALRNLAEVSLQNESEVLVVRDDAANAIRGVVLDLHNQKNDFGRAYKLLEVATQIAGTDSKRAQLTAELEQIKNSIDADASNTLTLEIPGVLAGGTVIFKGDHLTYGSTKIFYRDAISISYGATNTSINFIPVSQSYSYTLASEDDRINLTFGTTLFIGNKRKQDVWATLAGISHKIIEPHIIENLMKRMFVNDKEISIGGIVFNKKGYSQSKFFGGTEIVLWKDVKHIPQMSSGTVTLWKYRNEKPIAFATLKISTSNVVIIPELVKACIQRGADVGQ